MLVRRLACIVRVSSSNTQDSLTSEERSNPRHDAPPFYESKPFVETDSGYPKDTGDTVGTRQRGVFIPDAAAHHRSRTATSTDLHPIQKFFKFSLEQISTDKSEKNPSRGFRVLILSTQLI